MSTIARYTKFKRDCAGYVQVSFPEFRERLEPLRSRKSWDAQSFQRVEELVSEGAGRAIQQLCGAGHPECLKLFGPGEIRAEEMEADHLANTMRAFVDNFLRGTVATKSAPAKAPWSPEDFANYEKLLISGEGAASDYLVGMYLGSGPGFKRVVHEHLGLARIAAGRRG